MGKLTNIASQLGKYFSELSPQIKDDSLEWYLAGSLATMIMGDAKEYSEVVLDENNTVISFDDEKVISDFQREKIKLFERQLGYDIDVVNVNGNMFNGALLKGKLSIGVLKENVDNLHELIPSFNYIDGTAYIDNLDYEHDIKEHRVCKVTTSNGVIYMTSPPEQISYKLNDLLVVNEVMHNGRDVSKHYNKDFQDLIAMLYGYKDLYSKEELFERIANVLPYNLSDEVIEQVMGELRKRIDSSSKVGELVDFLNELLKFIYSKQQRNIR